MIRSHVAQVFCSAIVGAAITLSAAIPDPPGHSNLIRQVTVQDEYDYIIVGGGTAGLVVADRLTESGEYSVLVIEIGIFANDSSVNNVAGGSQAFANASLTFNFPSAPQQNLGNRTTGVVGGAILGGSSGVNGFQAHRPQKEDIDAWGRYFSDDSEWSWEALLPYFKKASSLEDNGEPNYTADLRVQAWRLNPPTPEMVEEFGIRYDESYWGNQSPIHASFPTSHYPFLRNEWDAMGEVEGVQFPVDSGAGDAGVFWYPHSAQQPEVVRSFALSGYWAGKGNVRPNYDTILESRVLRVLFDDENTAIGVEYVPRSARDARDARVVSARKEVILSAGTIHTPQILQASGVGPRSVLEAANIEVVVDLPGIFIVTRSLTVSTLTYTRTITGVGFNFQDHPLGGGATFLLTNFDVHPDPSDLQSNATFRAEAEAEFAANRSGPLSIASGNLMAFLPLKVVSPSRFDALASALEDQDPAAYLPSGTDATLVAGYAAQKSRLAALLRSDNSANYNLFLRGANFGGIVVYLHPLSRGTIYIDPTDPFFAQPIVDYRAASNPLDLDIQVEFLKFTRHFYTETSLKAYGPVELSPGAHITSDEALREAIRGQMSPTCFHPIGTSAMMPRTLGGVVSETLEVYGTVTDNIADPDTDQAPVRHFRGETRPGPTGIAAAYWGRIYNRADCRVVTGETRDTEARDERRRDGQTYRRALAILASDLVKAEQHSPSPAVQAKRLALLQTRDNLGPDFVHFLSNNSVHIRVNGDHWST
ncbi:hypothetical protein F5X68DRAFT_241315 [Plectosphaerella plurivora]|uniref:Glucose-methanol-choline oxidoreductase N-terminal domain-containing protein n=1 Tax=Plectosphaerella plurivora TaxID=936078 RepID=A0A9P8V9V7_9PEZI|nr:hypothetical protein F5X68DRAFT_241315 [Plectosphaerella plurivora]